MTANSPSIRPASAWPAALLVATALAFVPMQFLPSFDTPKLAVLVLGAAVVAAWTASRRAKTARDGVLADPILALPLLLAVVAAVAALVSWPRGSLVGPVAAIACVAVARLVAQTDDPRAAVRSLARGAAIAAAAAGAYALAQKAGLDFTPWRDRREPVATFGNTSFAAEFQAAALPLSLFLAVRRDAGRGDRALGAIAALLGVVHLWIATSRIDYGAAAAGLGVGACLLLVGRGRPRVALALAAAGVVAATLFAVAYFAAARGEGPKWLGRADTVAVRVDVWKSTTRMIAAAPLRIADAPFVDAYPAWRDADEYRISLGRVVETPHDDYLEIAASLGVPGLLVALGVVAALARRLVATARAHVAESAALGASLAAVAVSALASSPLSHPATALLPALVAGLVVALAPRPLRGWTLRALPVDVAFAAILALAFWPGPALRGVRADGFLALGRAEAQRGDVRRALLLFDQSAAVDPHAFDARFELGTLLKSAGQPADAVLALESAKCLRRNDIDCRVNLAYAMRDAGRRDDARRVVDESLAICPWHPLLLAARAVFALEDGRAAEALPDARRAAAGLPSDARLAALVAETRLLADPSDASYAAALDALTLLFERGDVEEMGRSARSMLRHDPGLAGPLVTRARRIVATKPATSAALALAAATAVKDDAGFLDDASQVLRLAGRADEAKILMGRSLGVRASLALSRGENQTALKFAEQAADRDPSPVHFLLAARAATRLGERSAAVEAVGAAVACGRVDADEVRNDPILKSLLPDRRLEDVLRSAARRSVENQSKLDDR